IVRYRCVSAAGSGRKTGCTTAVPIATRLENAAVAERYPRNGSDRAICRRISENPASASSSSMIARSLPKKRPGRPSPSNTKYIDCPRAVKRGFSQDASDDWRLEAAHGLPEFLLCRAPQPQPTATEFPPGRCHLLRQQFPGAGFQFLVLQLAQRLDLFFGEI